MQADGVIRTREPGSHREPLGGGVKQTTHEGGASGQWEGLLGTGTVQSIGGIDLKKTHHGILYIVNVLITQNWTWDSGYFYQVYNFRKV